LFELDKKLDRKPVVFSEGKNANNGILLEKEPEKKAPESTKKTTEQATQKQKKSKKKGANKK